MISLYTSLHVRPLVFTASDGDQNKIHRTQKRKWGEKNHPSATASRESLENGMIGENKSLLLR